MKEIESIIEQYERNRARGLKMALAIVVNVEQSSYRRSGARMLITEDGNWVGGISGGCLEGDAKKKALYSILNGISTKVTYDTREDDPSQIGVGLGCEGLIDVLITPITDVEPNPISILKEIVQRREPSVLVTNLSTGSTVDYTYKKHLDDHITKEINSVKSSHRSKMIKKGKGYFIEVVEPKISLFIFGRNYDVIPLAIIAKSLGWMVNVVANPFKVSKKLYDIADNVVSTKHTELSMDIYSVGLLMSHDFNIDKANLRILQKEELRYIGILGPKKRRIRLVDELRQEGIDIEESNLYGPMGLDTGAISPEEIAVSIISEIRAVFENRDGGYLKNRVGSIH